MVSLSMVFTLGGTTFTVSKTSDYRLVGYSGLEASDYEIDIADNAVGDGGYYQSSRVTPRSLSISFMVIDATKTASGRTAIMSFFKPKLLGSLAVTRGSTTRTIGFYLSGIEFINPDASVPKLRVTVNLICPDPYFYAATPTVVNAVARYATLNNTGDVECGFVATITANGGSVTGFGIGMDNAYVVIPYTITSGTTVTISTVPGNKYVAFNGSAGDLYDPYSKFFLLGVGANTVEYGADTGEANMAVSYSFVPRYLGV